MSISCRRSRVRSPNASLRKLKVFDMGNTYAPQEKEEQIIDAEALGAHDCREELSDTFSSPTAPMVSTPCAFLAYLCCFAVYMAGAAMVPYGPQVIKNLRRYWRLAAPTTLVRDLLVLGTIRVDHQRDFRFNDRIHLRTMEPSPGELSN